jgi:hypothetical protein
VDCQSVQRRNPNPLHISKLARCRPSEWGRITKGSAGSTWSPGFENYQRDTWNPWEAQSSLNFCISKMPSVFSSVTTLGNAVVGTMFWRYGGTVSSGLGNSVPTARFFVAGSLVCNSVKRIPRMSPAWPWYSSATPFGLVTVFRS